MLRHEVKSIPGPLLEYLWVFFCEISPPQKIVPLNHNLNNLVFTPICHLELC